MVILWTFSENTYSEHKWCMTTNVKIVACRCRNVFKTCRILSSMAGSKVGRPHKGPRQPIKTDLMPTEVKSAIVARAKHHDLDYGTYAADLLAIHVGRPDLVQALNAQTLELDLHLPPVVCDNPNYFITNPPLDVYKAIKQRAASHGIAMGQYMIRVCSDHINRTSTILDQEVLLIGA